MPEHAAPTTALPVTATDVWTVAQTVYGEARNQPLEGQIGVAHVLLNRQRLHRRWLGRPLHTIATARWQFSCWNDGDPNQLLVRAVRLTTPGFLACLHLTLDVLGGVTPSPVGAATHFHATTLAKLPGWAQGHTPVVVIGQHAFYSDIA